MKRALLAVLVVGLVVTTTASPAAGQEPILSVAPGPYEPGQEVMVNGAGWPGERIISLQTCGNGGLGGSVHCDHTSTRAASSDRNGSFGARLPVGRPPSPCPCTIRAFLVDGPAADAPIEINGLPRATPIPPDTPFVDGGLVVDATLEDTSSWTSWFGAPPTRTLVLTVENRSAQPITWLPLDLSWGRAGNPTGMIDAPVIDALEPGASTRVEVAVDLPALAFGSYVVRGEVLGHPGTELSLRTHAAPYGLMAVAGALVLQAILLRARNALARSVARRIDDVSEAPAEDAFDLEVVLHDDGEPDVLLDLRGSSDVPAREHEPA
jgi:hypothetical protein